MAELIGTEEDNALDIIALEYDGIKNTTDTILMTVFCDTTTLYTEEENESENLTDLEFPKSVVKDYYRDKVYKPTPYCSISQCEEDDVFQHLLKDGLMTIPQMKLSLYTTMECM